MATSLQYATTTQRAWVSTASAGGHAARVAVSARWSGSDGNATSGGETDNALTFKSDHSIGAGHQRKQAQNEKHRVEKLLGSKRIASLGANELFEDPITSLFDVWAEGRFTYFKDDAENTETKGHFGVLYVGADMVVSPSVLLGVMAQFDDIDTSSASLSQRVAGRGWMVGPYATIRLTDNLYFQGRAAWGRSENKISPFLTYTDTFDTERWLVRGKFKGFWSHNGWTFSPSASLAYIEELQESYTDSLNVRIPEQRVSLGQIEFGPEFSYKFQIDDGTKFEPHLALKGIWNFAGGEDVAVSAGKLGRDDIRARLEGGLKIHDREGRSVEFFATYDGIGSDDLEAVSGTARIRIPLN